MGSEICQITDGDTCLAAVAIHDGHAVREEVAQLFALGGPERLREEDPFTGLWTAAAETRIVGKRSRFEVDLNRPRERAVYLMPEDAWGLQVWKQVPPPDLIDRSLEKYDEFYAEAYKVFSNMERRFGRFVVFDLHSYNHRRSGPGGRPADASENPEVNVGTGTMVRDRWASVVDRFIADLRTHDFLDRRLDVRENVKFRGGEFSRWIHTTFPNSGCALAIEFKKFFMDEWSGEAAPEQLEAITRALRSTTSGILEALEIES